MSHPARSTPARPANSSPSDSPDINKPRQNVLRSMGLGLITGAADDDPSAIGTYAAAGAKMGPSFLWIALPMFPMMFVVVHLSGKLGQVTGQGLFEVLRQHAPRWLLYSLLAGAVVGNTIEAAADLGGMAAAANLLVPVPFAWTVVAIAGTILVLQMTGSYVLIRDIFRWFSLALLAYIGAAFLVKPELMPVLRGTFIPTLSLFSDSWSMLVAVMGASLSAYLYTWQSNEEVEENIARGRARQGANAEEIRAAKRDVLFGMFFSSLVMYFIMLSTAETLHKAGITEISTAAEAARALQPIAGDAAEILFAVGIVSVGFIAVPVMTIGAAYDLSQTMGWKWGLNASRREAARFYAAVAAFTLAAAAMNFSGINPMKALVLAGIVQGFSTPPLMLLVMLLTNNRAIMGEHVNGRGINILGWITTVAMFAATIGLIVTLVV